MQSHQRNALHLIYIVEHFYTPEPQLMLFFSHLWTMIEDSGYRSTNQETRESGKYVLFPYTSESLEHSVIENKYIQCACISVKMTAFLFSGHCQRVTFKLDVIFEFFFKATYIRDRYSASNWGMEGLSQETKRLVSYHQHCDTHEMLMSKSRNKNKMCRP